MSGPSLAPALAFLASACAASHGIGVDAGGPASDGPERAPCTTARGAELCETPECPVDRCPDVCVWGWTGGPTDAPGFCAIGPQACAPSMGCPRQGLCLDELQDPRSFFLGICASEAVCAELRYRGYPVGCRYTDGTLFETGSLRVEECPSGFDGIACGPGCAPCDAGATCVGPSEHSGVGICHVLGSLWLDGRCSQDPRERCQNRGDACLFLLAPRDEVWTRRGYFSTGFCIAPETCGELAAARPDRFECLLPSP